MGEALAQLGVHLDACVGADRVSGLGAACSQPLDSPAYLSAIHGSEVAGGSCDEGAGVDARRRFTTARRMTVLAGICIEDGDVSALGCNDAEPGPIGCTAAEDFVGEGCSQLG